MMRAICISIAIDRPARVLRLPVLSVVKVTVSSLRIEFIARKIERRGLIIIRPKESKKMCEREREGHDAVHGDCSRLKIADDRG